MNSNPCCLCQSPDHYLYLPRVYAFEGQLFDLQRCRECGLVRVSPMPDVETIRRFYTKEYFEKDYSCGIRSASYLEGEAARGREYREILAVIKKHKSFGKLLEVGCAAGGFLHIAQESGYDVEGVDISAWAAKAAKEHYGVKVSAGRLRELNLPSDSFDVVFIGDLLEHEWAPVEFLHDVKRVLKSGGLIAIKVPIYVNSFYFRVAHLPPLSWLATLFDARLQRLLKLSQGEPQGPPYHLYEFSLANLKNMFAQIGVRIIERRNYMLTPEFLDKDDVGLVDKAARFGFKLLGFLGRFNLPASHVLFIAVK